MPANLDREIQVKKNCRRGPRVGIILQTRVDEYGKTSRESIQSNESGSGRRVKSGPVSSREDETQSAPVLIMRIEFRLELESCRSWDPQSPLDKG